MNKSVGRKSTLEAKRPKHLFVKEEHPSLRNHFLSYSPHPLPDTLSPSSHSEQQGNWCLTMCQKNGLMQCHPAHCMSKNQWTPLVLNCKFLLYWCITLPRVPLSSHTHCPLRNTKSAQTQIYKYMQRYSTHLLPPGGLPEMETAVFLKQTCKSTSKIICMVILWASREGKSGGAQGQVRSLQEIE